MGGLQKIRSHVLVGMNRRNHPIPMVTRPVMTAWQSGRCGGREMLALLYWNYTTIWERAKTMAHWRRRRIIKGQRWIIIRLEPGSIGGSVGTMIAAGTVLGGIHYLVALQGRPAVIMAVRFKGGNANFRKDVGASNVPSSTPFIRCLPRIFLLSDEEEDDSEVLLLFVTQQIGRLLLLMLCTS